MKPQESAAIHADAYEAIRYFYEIGMIENLHGDQHHYVEALIKYAANKMNIELG
jgi:hypothetical protein